jgi:uncharacterized protein YhfF
MTDTSHFSFAFGNTSEIADDRLAKVIAGQKTATSSPASSYTVDDPSRPEVGRRCIVLDGAGSPTAMIETMGIKEVPYGELDEAHAIAEGYASLAQWRDVHEYEYCENGKPVLGKLVLCETFRLIEVLC